MKPTLEDAIREMAINEAIPIDVGVAARQVMAEMAKFMKQWKAFEKSMLNGKSYGGHDSGYGQALNDLPDNKTIGYDQKDLKKIQKQYSHLAAKWKQFDQAAWSSWMR